MQVTNEFQPGDENNFTGQVLIALGNGATEKARLYQVIFTPGARTNWHTHEGDQTLIVMTGKAWISIKEDGKVTKKELKAGESCLIPKNLEHWHGASPDGLMQHLAITHGETTWKDEVTDEEYYNENDPDIIAEMTQLAFAFAEAEQTRNEDFFEKHLAKKLVFQRVNGKVVNKKSFIEGLKDLKYDYNIPFQIAVSPGSDKLSAAVTLRVAARITGNSTTKGVWRNIRLFQKRKGQWQLTGWYNEPI